jgi:RNA polymerase sigma factor (sigma-70 family)
VQSARRREDPVDGPEQEPVAVERLVPGHRPEEIARLFREHNRALVSFLCLRLQSLDEAKEVAQEAYARILRLDKEGTPGFLRFYLFRVAANLATDRLRQRTRQARYASGIFAELETNNEPEARALAGQELSRLSQYLEELPERCRQALFMFRVDDLSQEEIANRLDVTTRMARRYISYALTYCRLRIDGATAKDAREHAKL